MRNVKAAILIPYQYQFVWFLVNAANTKEKLSFIELERCPLMTSEKLILVEVNVARVVKLLQTVLVPECTVLLLVLHSTSNGSE